MQILGLVPENNVLNLNYAFYYESMKVFPWNLLRTSSLLQTCGSGIVR